MRTLAALLAERALSQPEALYVACSRRGGETTSLTYEATWRLACRWAALLAERGLARGDRVVLALPNGQDFVGAFFGAVLSGVVPAATAPIRSFAGDETMVASLFDRMRSLEATTLLVPESQAAEARAQRGANGTDLSIVSRRDLPETAPDIAPTADESDTVFLQLTSGTTGPTRAVQLRHAAVMAQIEGIASSLELDAAVDCAVSWLPLYHDMGLIGFLLTPAFIGRHVTMLRNEDFALRPGIWLQALTETGATVTGGPPSAFQLCARRIREAEAESLDLSRVRIALVGAEMVTAQALENFATRFAASGFRRSSLVPTYGLAENGLAATMPPLGRGPLFDTVDLETLESTGRAGPPSKTTPRTRSFVSVGHPLPGVEVAVVDREQHPVDDRHIGEIVIRGATMMTGYLNRPDATREALKNGWLHTGDLGYLVDGELHVTGRLKEVLIVGGRNYSPEDLEQAVADVPGVRARRVVALSLVDEATSTEQVAILAETGLTEPTARDQLQHSIRRRLAEAGYPVDRVLLLPPRAITTTDSGKLKRLSCRERFLESSTT